MSRITLRGRESEIEELSALGYSGQEIALSLGVNPSTLRVFASRHGIGLDQRRKRGKRTVRVGLLLNADEGRQLLRWKKMRGSETISDAAREMLTYAWLAQKAELDLRAFWAEEAVA